jgi:hypothetical protein
MDWNDSSAFLQPSPRFCWNWLAAWVQSVRESMVLDSSNVIAR